MAIIDFSEHEKRNMVSNIQSYFREELDQDIGGFDAEFLLDFFAEQFGTLFYNRGVYDAQAVLADKIDEVSDAIYMLEKPAPERSE